MKKGRMREYLRIYSHYSLLSILHLFLLWVRTKIFYPKARLIRRPFYMRGRSRITWGRGFTTGVGVRIDSFTESCSSNNLITIGHNVQLNDYVHIAAIQRVVIGDDVLVASRVFITDHNHGCYGSEKIHSNPHGKPADRPLVSAPVVIESNVWIGESVTILPGVTVGFGAVLAAGAIVTKNVPPKSIVAGNPAKVIKTFNENTERWESV